VGMGVANVSEGDHVALLSRIPCLNCKYCDAGCWALGWSC
jgi:Zn-dependent alcohol dehydrogenase